jgi:hypothetical protein
MGLYRKQNANMLKTTIVSLAIAPETFSASLLIAAGVVFGRVCLCWRQMKARSAF